MLFENEPNQEDDFLANLDSDFNQECSINAYDIIMQFNNNEHERDTWK